MIAFYTYHVKKALLLHFILELSQAPSIIIIIINIIIITINIIIIIIPFHPIYHPTSSHSIASFNHTSSSSCLYMYATATPGKFMMRLRVPNGILNSQQLRYFADVVEPYGPEVMMIMIIIMIMMIVIMRMIMMMIMTLLCERYMRVRI